MTNENVLKHLGVTYSNMAKEQYPSSDDCENVYATINLIKSQQSRIEVLESAIREFLNDESALHINAHIHIETFTNLMENKS